MKPMIHAVILVVCSGVAHAQPAGSATAAVAQLLAADRHFAAVAPQRSVVDALGAMFAPDVSMQTPQGFVNGRDAVLAAVRANPVNQRGSLTWVPIRGGISGDGQHGFTFGYMTHRRDDSTSVPIKYMAYWVRRADGWRVTVYKRSVSSAAPASLTPMAPSLPARWGATLANASTASRDLAAAEAAFSDLAGKVGLREAFRLNGLADAVNMGGGSSASYVVGANAIAESVGQGEAPGTGSALRWSSDRVIVAASGDLGISIGTIVAPPQTAGGTPARIPFFTIWRRNSASEPWRYVAE